jgi:type III secretion protein C
MKICSLTVGILGLLLLPAMSAESQTLTWKEQDFSVRARNLPLKNLLENLAENYNTPVHIDPSVNGTFSGAICPDDPLTILKNLSAQYNLISWYDGNTLFIYPQSCFIHRVITLKTLPAKSFLQYLKDRKVITPYACDIRRIPDVNAVDVNGVPACITRITQLSSMLDNDLTRRQGEAVSVAVYPLKYATATDENYQYRDQTVVLPGIVSVLREMGRASVTTAGTAAVTQDTGLPLFSADSRQNAVIVRDRTTNMASYRKLIQELDVRPQMIEISVSIIDVDAGVLSQLGIDWSAAVSLGGNKISFNASGGTDSGFSAIIDNTSGFMARLTALEKNSHAYILSQPSVVTLNNIQAVLDRNITFYTKLEGDKVAKLESIITGSLLRVTPRLLNENGEQRIMLSLNIKDGQQNPPLDKSEPLPMIQSSEIASQATLVNGQSLLLGGFKQDKQLQTEKKIPLLGDIPGLGRLFRNDINQTQSVIRLFLIKATVANGGIHHER